MIISSENITLADLEGIAERQGMTLHNARALEPTTRGRNAGRYRTTLTLRPQPTAQGEYRREIRKGKRLYACNWQAHADFMRAVFHFDANAEIDSALARYRGVAEFEALHKQTDRHGLGGFTGKVTAA